jgi:2-pyrone-4,6-dicarboxylate lactonase
MTQAKASFNPNPGKPRLRLPQGACDAHFHVFGPPERFPYAKDASYTPATEAPKEALFKLHEHLGIERGVVVQSAAHGFDNSAAADLIAARPSGYRGVALIHTDIASGELQKLNAQGFRAARFNYMRHLGAGSPIEDVLRLAGRLAGIGWHLQIHLESTLIEEMAPALKRSPVPVVIDHMGRIDASLGMNQKPLRDLLRLVEDAKFW